jgi:hypothetical protein
MPDVNLDRAGPVNDNAAALKKRASQHSGKSKGGMAHGAGQGVPHQGKPSHQPVATSMLGSLHVLDLAHHHKHDVNHGVAGIIHSTTTGPHVRHRLLSGILDLHDGKGRKADGPVHSVTGHDATARNAGMRPIPGSPFH